MFQTAKQTPKLTRNSRFGEWIPAALASKNPPPFRTVRPPTADGFARGHPQVVISIRYPVGPTNLQNQGGQNNEASSTPFRRRDHGPVCRNRDGQHARDREPVHQSPILATATD